jgi:hypothetical protein
MIRHQLITAHATDSWQPLLRLPVWDLCATDPAPSASAQPRSCFHSRVNGRPPCTRPQAPLYTPTALLEWAAPGSPAVQAG